MLLVIIHFLSISITCTMNVNVNISCEIYELFKSVVNDNSDDYYIDIEGFNGIGEGFIGDVLFVTITCKKSRGKQHFVIKQQKCLDGKALSYTDTAFDNEMYFYSIMWPTLQTFFLRMTKKPISIVPKCVGTLNGELKKIALENISSQGFVTYDKRKPFDDDHLTLIFTTYGTFHAVSMAFKEQNIEEYKKLVEPLRQPDIATFKDDNFPGKYLKFVLQQVREMFEKDSDAVLIDQLKCYEKSGLTLLNNCWSDGRSNGILLHGDCWSNNLMFKYEESGKVSDMRVIDFQIISSGSPVFDLSYCIYSGGSAEIFDKLDHYLKIYHSSLKKTLNEFGMDADKLYPLTVLKNEWKKFCKYGYALGILLWNIKLADKDALVVAEEEDMKPFKIAEGLQEECEKRIRELTLHVYKNDFL